MSTAVVGQLGEVEQKLVNLVEEVFQYYPERQTDDEGNDCITKDQCRDFIKKLMVEAEEDDAWDDKEFDECY